MSPTMTDTTATRLAAPDWCMLFRRALDIVLGTLFRRAREIVMGALVAGVMALAPAAGATGAVEFSL